MIDPTKNTNPKISAEIAGIGYLSPRGEELKDVARIELEFVREHIKNYNQNEQKFILEILKNYILDILIKDEL